MAAERERTTIGEVCSFASGYSFPVRLQGEQEGDHPFFKVGDMNTPGNERILTHANNWVSAAVLSEMGARVWPTGTVAFPKVGAALLTEKRRILGCEGAFDNNIMGLIPGERLLPPFLLLLMERTRLAEIAQRGAVPSVNQALVGSIEIALPSLAEQRRIVDLVESVSSSRAASMGLEEATSSLLDQFRFQYVDAFGGKWEPLSQVASITSRLVDPTLPEYADLPHIGVEAIEQATGELGDVRSAAADGVTSGKFHFSAEEVVYSKIRPNLRKAVFPRFGGLCSADAYPLTPNPSRITAEYLLEVLLSNHFTRRAVLVSGRTRTPKVNREALFSINVPVPPLGDQRRFTGTFVTTREVRSKARQDAARLHAVRQAVMNDLLTGRRRLDGSYDRFLEAV